MPPLRVRALVLAAGLATRLRPLTVRRPKALLPVLGEPLIARTLARLEAFGVEATAVNLHHCGEDIVRTLGARFGKMELVYSREEAVLGTLGALAPLRDFLAAADLVLLVNGDTLCDWPFAELVERHVSAGVEATLLLTERADPASFGGVGVDAGGYVVSYPGAPAKVEVACERVFAGCHVFGPDLLARVPRGRSEIVADLWPGLVGSSQLAAHVSSAPWHDLGTPRRYLDALLEEVVREGIDSRGWIAAGAQVSSRARVVGGVVERGARVEAGARCRDCALLGGATVAGGADLERVLLAEGVAVPAGLHLSDVMLTPAAWGPGAESREVGELVATPLGVRGRSQ